MTKNFNLPNHFAYDESHIAHLAKRCPKLGEAIAHIGKIERNINPDLFRALPVPGQPCKHPNLPSGASPAIPAVPAQDKCLVFLRKRKG